jgi:hypothetical protein
MGPEKQISNWKRALAGIRRLGRPAQRRANWEYLAVYWSLRKRLRSFSFHVLRTRHSIGTRAGSVRESTHIVLLLLRLIGGAFLFSITLIGVCAAIDFSFRSLIASTEAGVSRWPIVATIYANLKKLHFHGDAASALLGTLAQIAGVFLGLYFAVVGTLVSTRYANVPPNVRELMITDKFGNQYIRLVALFGAVATLLLAAQSLGIPFGLLNLAVVTILGVATILSFVILGRRAFEFFDPGSLVNQVGSELVGWINRAARLRHFGRQHSFQAYYQKQAAELLDSYDGVVRMAVQDEICRQHTLPYLARHALGILSYYGRRKNRIASESYWFRRQYEHKNWLTTDFSETSIALQTGTMLSPKEVPDLMWFERETTGTFWLAYKKLLDNADLEKAATVSLAAADALGEMGNNLLMTEAVAFAGTWAPFFRAESAKTKVDAITGEAQQKDLAQHLGIVECYALGAIRLLLSFAAAVSGERNERLRKSLSEPDWLSGDAVFELNAPRPVIIEAEGMRDLVDFEQQAAGARLTTPWFLRQRIAFAYCTWYRDSIEALLTQFECVFGTDLEALVSESCWLAAASVSNRALEACSKFQNHLKAMRRAYDGWVEWRGQASYDWPLVDWDAVAERLSKLEERIEISASALLVPLSAYKKVEAFPDFFGQALGTSTKACFDAIAFDRDQQIAKMFSPLFVASFAAFERLRKELKDYPAETNVIFSTEPIENLMELSGYAIIYSELGPKNPWSSMKATWERYFASVGDGPAIAKWLATIMKVRGNHFGLGPGDLQRTSWKQHFEHDMRRRGWLVDHFSRSPWDRGRENSHASAIVRALLRGGHMFSDLSDVFLMVYLKGKIPDGDLSLTTKTKSFADALDRENKRSPENENEGEYEVAE